MGNTGLLADPYQIVNRWKNCFCQLLDVQAGVGQIEMHTREPFVPELSSLESEVATGKFKSYKSSGVDMIPAELI
jgi:hypothetical protein